MTMNNETPEPTPATLADAMPVSIADLLRTQLDTPKPKDESWQDEAGRAVSLLAVGFLKDTNDESALRSVALLGLAQSLGVKEARKRTLKLSRWAEAAPPPLTSLMAKDEQQAAAAALSKLKTSWALHYIDQQLHDLSLEVELIPELLKWAKTASPDWATFVFETYAGAIKNCGDSARLSAMLKDASKLLRSPDALPVEQVAEPLSAILRAIVGAASNLKEDEKASLALLYSGYAVYEHSWKSRPALLFTPVLLNALAQLTAVMKILQKQLPGNIDEAMLATLSVVSDSIRRFGTDAVRQYRPMVSMWAAAYSEVTEKIKLAVVLDPALAGLLFDEAEPKTGADQSYLAEAAFASLLPAWDAFVSGLADPDQAASLSLMLNRAASTVNVERQGTVGETVSYDPLAHHLGTPVDPPPLKVKVLRSGVLARRVDGSQRTLVQTLVTAA